MADTDFSTLILPGRNRMRVPIVKTKEVNELSGVSKATPEWLVTADTIFARGSMLESGNSYGSDGNQIELFGFTDGAERETSSHIANQLISSPALRLSDLTIIVQNGTYAPICEQYMNTGQKINTITIKRYGRGDGNGGGFGARICLEERIFTICYITRFQQILDYLALQFRVCTQENKVFAFSQDSMALGGSGNFVSVIDGTAMMK